MLPRLPLIFLSVFAPIALGANGGWTTLVADIIVDAPPDPRFMARRS